jgi:hypothetical protein
MQGKQTRSYESGAQTRMNTLIEAQSVQRFSVFLDLMTLDLVCDPNHAVVRAN